MGGIWYKNLFLHISSAARRCGMSK